MTKFGYVAVVSLIGQGTLYKKQDFSIYLYIFQSLVHRKHSAKFLCWYDGCSKLQKYSHFLRPKDIFVSVGQITLDQEAREWPSIKSSGQRFFSGSTEQFFVECSEQCEAIITFSLVFKKNGKSQVLPSGLVDISSPRLTARGTKVRVSTKKG